MPSYDPPLRDFQFIVHDVLNIGRYANLPPFAEADRDTLDAILDETGKICRDVIAPMNRSSDLEGCTRHEDGSVTAPKGFKEIEFGDELPLSEELRYFVEHLDTPPERASGRSAVGVLKVLEEATDSLTGAQPQTPATANGDRVSARRGARRGASGISGCGTRVRANGKRDAQHRSANRL